MCNSQFQEFLILFSKFFFSLPCSIYAYTKNERKTPSKLFTSNTQQLRFNNIYSLFCLNLFSKDIHSCKEFISLISSYYQSLFITTERLLNSYQSTTRAPRDSPAPLLTLMRACFFFWYVQTMR